HLDKAVRRHRGEYGCEEIGDVLGGRRIADDAGNEVLGNLPQRRRRFVVQRLQEQVLRVRQSIKVSHTPGPPPHRGGRLTPIQDNVPRRSPDERPCPAGQGGGVEPPPELGEIAPHRRLEQFVAGELPSLSDRFAGGAAVPTRVDARSQDVQPYGTRRQQVE